MRRIWLIALLGIVATVCGGCPLADTVPGGNMDTNPGKTTGILVSTVAGAQALNVDVYDAATGARVAQAKSSNQVIELSPGQYNLTEYFNTDFLIAAGVTVRPGEVVTVALGAVRVQTVAGSAAITFDIYDASGQTLLDQANDTDVIRPVTPGVYVLKEYFNDVFDFARDVAVVAGEVTTVVLGAIDLRTAPDANATYDIYDASGQTLLDRVNDANVIRAVPPGEYVLKEYFNEGLVFAAGVIVSPGAVAERTLGAIRYGGVENSYDIHGADGQTLLVRPASKGEPRSLPAGTYVLKAYFTDRVLAAQVSVATGTTTVVP